MADHLQGSRAAPDFEPTRSHSAVLPKNLPHCGNTHFAHNAPQMVSKAYYPTFVRPYIFLTCSRKNPGTDLWKPSLVNTLLFRSILRGTHKNHVAVVPVPAHYQSKASCGADPLTGTATPSPIFFPVPLLCSKVYH